MEKALFEFHRERSEKSEHQWTEINRSSSLPLDSTRCRFGPHRARRRTGWYILFLLLARSEASATFHNGPRKKSVKSSSRVLHQIERNGEWPNKGATLMANLSIPANILPSRVERIQSEVEDWPAVLVSTHLLYDRMIYDFPRVPGTFKMLLGRRWRTTSSPVGSVRILE